jgi:hypothetical protein
MVRTVCALTRRAAVALVQALGVRRVPERPTGPSLEQICADLHRLESEIATLLADPTRPALYHRLQAVSWAYDRALKDACIALGLPAPDHDPLDQFERLAAEAELTAAGLRW